MNGKIVNIINSMNEDVVEYKDGVYYIGFVDNIDIAYFIVEQFNRILYYEGIDAYCYATGNYTIYIREMI